MKGSYLVLEKYSRIVDSLLQASLSMNSASVYCQGLQSFFNFRYQFPFQQFWPLPVDYIIILIAYLSKSGIAFSTSKRYLAGLSYVVSING